jgi:hypothetical protein
MGTYVNGSVLLLIAVKPSIYDYQIITSIFSIHRVDLSSNKTPVMIIPAFGALLKYKYWLYICADVVRCSVKGNLVHDVR